MTSKYQDLIETLRYQDPYFSKLYDQHHQLDCQIQRITKDSIVLINTPTINELKREKLHLKEQIYTLLEKASAVLPS